jgi:hypothetical protein
MSFTTATSKFLHGEALEGAFLMHLSHIDWIVTSRNSTHRLIHGVSRKWVLSGLVLKGSRRDWHPHVLLLIIFCPLIIILKMRGTAPPLARSIHIRGILLLIQHLPSSHLLLLLLHGIRTLYRSKLSVELRLALSLVVWLVLIWSCWVSCGGRSSLLRGCAQSVTLNLRTIISHVQVLLSDVP